MTTLKLDAYIPSMGEYKKYSNKFYAFMGADVSKKAKEQGAYCAPSYPGKGLYPLRSIDSFESGLVDGIIYCIYPSSTPIWVYSTTEHTGLRIAFKVKYNPNSKLVKDCRTEERTALKHGKKNISSAPIVKFGGKDCIWLNKEDCENGKSKEMELWTLDLVEKAVPFNRNDTEQPLMSFSECRQKIDEKTTDFAKATELIAQCDRVLKENCTKEELDMIVPVEMRSEDDYEKTTPIYENEDDYDVSL